MANNRSSSNTSSATIIKSAKVWDVLSPPPVNSVAGKFAPTILSTGNRKRITIEVRTRAAIKNFKGKVNLVPSGFSRNGDGTLGDEDICVFRFYEKKEDAKVIRHLTSATKQVTVGTLNTAKLPVQIAMSAAETASKWKKKLGSRKKHIKAYTRGVATFPEETFLDNNNDDASTACSNNISAVSVPSELQDSIDQDDRIMNIRANGHGQHEANSQHHRDHPSLKSNNDQANTSANTSATIVSSSLLSGKIRQEPGDEDMNNKNDDDGWFERYVLPLDNIIVYEIMGNICVIGMFIMEDQWTRELIFDSEKDSIAFARLIRHQKKLERDRAKKIVQALMPFNSKTKVLKEKITFLIEIVSAWDLHGVDFMVKKSDPFVVVQMGTDEIHRTSVLPRLNSPVWTVRSGSLFTIEVTCSNFFFDFAAGICFEVRDADPVAGDTSLGAVVVPPEVLFQCNGERLEFSLQKLGAREYSLPTTKGSLALRCRRATPDDLSFFDFMESSGKRSGSMKKVGLLTEDKSAVLGNGAHFLSGIVHNSNVKYEASEELTVSDASDGKTKTSKPSKIKKYRVRPRPDPETEEIFMTKEEINCQVFQKSRKWLEAGSGVLGRIFLEILGCDNLIDMDVGLQNKTDSFCTVVYDDTMVQSDVIFDCLSPRWLPWSQRAFLFHVQYPTSPIFLGVFDYDTDNVLASHSPIGRIVVDISNFASNTDYILRYDLYTSNATNIGRKVVNGTISIRLRIEWESERSMLLMSLIPPPESYINFEKGSSFRLARYVCDGEVRVEEYSLEMLSAYLDELYNLSDLWFYIENAFYALVLWRGTYSVHFYTPNVNIRSFDENQNHKYGWFRKVTVKLPIHSAWAFTSLVALVERPALFPAFFWATLGWFMLATLESRRANPAPFERPKSFLGYLLIMLGLKRGNKAERVNAYQNAEEAASFRNLNEESIAKRRKEADEKYQRRLDEDEIWNQEVADIKVTLATKAFSTRNLLSSVNPLKPWLYPVQQYLGFLCSIVRMVRNVVLWENSVYSFWLTLGSITTALLCLFIPWSFIFRWTARIFVWALFGPWMKLVDVFYIEENLSSEKKQRRQSSIRKTKDQAFEAAASAARVIRENATKLKDFKVFLFGKYIVQIPRFNLNRYLDKPKYCSEAKPHLEKKKTMAQLALSDSGKDRIPVPGQRLHGEMIYRSLPVPLTVAPMGEAVSRPSNLDKPLVITPGFTAVIITIIISSTLTLIIVPLAKQYMNIILDFFHNALQQYHYIGNPLPT